MCTIDRSVCASLFGHNVEHIYRRPLAGMKVFGSKVLLTFIFSFFIISSAVAMNSQDVVTMQDAARYFLERGISRGVIVVSSEKCGACVVYDKILNSYFGAKPAIASKFLLIKLTAQNRPRLMGANTLISDLGVMSVPATFVVTAGPSGLAVEQSVPTVLNSPEFLSTMARIGMA
ncbi:uncharacterized protein NEMAJ01_0839 [Nematocida major]|uniref:uncharacterized protein n=1 Tax=Nematocida major TaxID=1912982 RepID=UPI00200799DD|nr:uncharacterized protein NEMAJ01_0839 [Nematocida major]KAH9385943.1 hypothetical protein NEMAJ01_0839 [Nematocida major]